MKNQYVGDVGDYGKYGLLRHFAKHGVRIGINWYLTEDDGSKDGKHISYLQKADMRSCDPELFDVLKQIAFRKDKSVQMIEDSNIITDAVYYNAVLKTSAENADVRKWTRRLWYNNSNLFFGDAELIFCDPDNGLIGKKTVRAKDSEKYVLPSEIAEYYNDGKNVLYYCHKGRRKWQDWEAEKVRMKEYLRDAQIVVLTYRKGTQRSYVFVIHPDDYKRYLKILAGFERTGWRSVFYKESVNGEFPGEQREGEPLKVDLSDGASLTIEKQADGNVCISTTKRPNERVIITSDMLAYYLHV